MSKSFMRKYVTISTSVPLKITTDRTSQEIELLPGFYQFENDKDERYTFTPDIGEDVKVSDTDVFFHEGVRSVDGEIDALDADLEMMAGAMEAMGDAIDGLSANDTALNSRLTTAEGDINSLNTLVSRNGGDIGTIEETLSTMDSAGWVTETRIADNSISNAKIKLAAVRSGHLYMNVNSPTSASTANGATVVVTGPAATVFLLRVTLGATTDWRVLSIYSNGSNWCVRLLNNTGATGTCQVFFAYLNS